MEDPHFDPLGVFNISVFNRSDSDKVEGEHFVAASKNEGFGCSVWNEEVLKSGRKFCAFYETGYNGLTVFAAVEAVYFGQLTGLAQDQQFVRPQQIAVCAFQSFEESSMSPAFTPSIFPMQFHNLNHLELRVC